MELEDKARRLAELIMQLHRFLQEYENEIMHSPQADLTLREWKVIDFLGQKCPCIMREIAIHMGLAVSTVTGIVDRLVQKGLVIRQRPEEDRRIVEVKLTPRGLKAEQWHFSQHMQMSKGILQSLNKQDQSSLLNLMNKVIENDKARHAPINSEIKN